LNVTNHGIDRKAGINFAGVSLIVNNFIPALPLMNQC
jgi:hypothetical protein